MQLKIIWVLHVQYSNIPQTWRFTDQSVYRILNIDLTFFLLTYDPAIIPLCLYLKENTKTKRTQETCYHMHVATDQSKQPIYGFNLDVQWIKENILWLNHKEEQNYIFQIIGAKSHHVKQNKPDSKRKQHMLLSYVVSPHASLMCGIWEQQKR